MKKVKISHEVPFCLLEQSREFNDYDYLLPHLMNLSYQMYGKIMLLQLETQNNGLKYNYLKG